eukprot:gb/GECH01014150.1/.p1 GENE.gb/GECH01014150.1/~~gb/GECH01014150.1/.p1  ORF type:complete len:1141 (+),score=236.04 gb/GECH01014150.1/:1-3423(+)
MWSHQKTTSRSIKERLMTHEDPLRLILRYKKIPGKLLLHVLLVCFVTAQLILYAQKQPFLAHNSKAFSEQFLPDGYKNIEESSTGYVTYVFHDVSDITRDFDRTIAKFYGFVNESPDVFSYMTQNTTAENHFMRASVSLRTQSTRDVLQGDTKPKDYNAKLIDWPTVYISCNDTWDSIIRDQYASNNRDFFDRLHHLQFVMELRSIDDPDADHPNCVHWTIYKNYYQQGTGSTISTLEYDYDSNCPGYPDRGMARRPITWVCTVGMLVSLVQIILHLRSFVNRHRLYKIIAKKRNILSQYTGRRKRADAKSRAETIKQYSASVITGWMVFTVFVASFNLVVGFVLIFSQPYGRAADTSFYLNLFLAADGFLVWMNCLRYFQFSPKLYILILTLKNGMPKVIQFVTGALPVFFGYAFAGTILFGHYAHYFDSFSASCITLFAIMNGDAMHDIFDMIYGFNPFLAQLSRFYLYTFVVLFICCVLNIFILIMEDAFFFVKRYISEHKDTFDMTLMSDHAVGQHLDRITQSDSDSSSSSSSSSTSSSDSSLSSSDEEQGDQTQDRGGGNKDQAEISPSDETPSRSIPRSHSAAQAIMSRGGSGSLGRPKLSFRSRKGLARASTLRRVNTSDMLDTETEGFSSSFYLSGADDGYEDYGGDEDYDDDDKEDDEEDEEEEDYDDTMSTQTEEPNEKEQESSNHEPGSTFMTIWGYVWTIGFAWAAASITFWAPSKRYISINFFAMALNVSGSLIIGVVTAFQQVKYQYPQTYLMYDAIKGGFCSVFTTFGNFIEDSDILLNFKYGFWKSLFNIVATLVLSFITYQLGRFLALKWKAGAGFSWELMTMENEDRRMEFEANKLEDEEDLEHLPENNDYDKENELPHSVSSRSLTDRFSGPLRHSSSLSLLSKWKNPSRNTSKRSGINADNSDMSVAFSHQRLADLDAHIQQQLEKKKRHTSPWPQRRHWIILISVYVLPFISLVLVWSLPELAYYVWLEPQKRDNNFAMLHFWINVIWGVSGALTGGFIGSLGRISKHDVQWGTFRVNTISCVLIGTAHNILLLRHYFPFGNREVFYIIFESFVESFCGSESSFAGFIDETTTLFNSKIPKKVSIRNFFYNLILCMIIFFIVVYSVRFIFFYNIHTLVF